MAETPEEMPLIDFQPEKIFSSWRATLKLCGMIALVCAVYGCLHVSIRTYLLKSKRLQHISVMVAESEKMLQNLYTLDQNLAADMEELNDFYLDYY